MNNDVLQVAETIISCFRQRSSNESFLVAISGIDGAGKGYVTSHIAQELRDQGLRTEVIHVDGWLNLPSVRFHEDRSAEHFYRNAIRCEEMFEQLILPLKRQRSIQVEANFAEETASTYRRHEYRFENVDVILLEGIYLLTGTSAALRLDVVGRLHV